jgi:pimeloyl-ACP methyl ester carboxylesterase
MATAGLVAATPYPKAEAPRCAVNRHGEIERLQIEVVHWFVRANGIVWHLVTAGEPDREAVLLLHGFPESWYAWRYQIAALGDRFFVIAPDIVPYGQSDKRSDLDYRYEAIARGIASLAEALGVRAFNLVGHDRGSVIGDHLAAMDPSRVRVLRYVRMQQSADRPRQRAFPPQWVLGSRLGTLLYRARRFPETAYRGDFVTRPIPEDVVARLDFEFKYEGVAEAVPLSFATTSYEQERRDRLDRLFPRMTMPVLFLQGRFDPAQSPVEYETATHSVADGELVFVDTGHFLHLEAPDEVNARILEFLTRPLAREPS